MPYNCGFAKKLCEFVELFVLDIRKRKCVLNLFSLALVFRAVSVVRPDRCIYNVKGNRQ